MKITRGITVAITVLALTAGSAVAAQASGGLSQRSETSVRTTSEPVTVQDISISVPGQDPVSAYLVRPSGPARRNSLAGIVYLHWFEPPASTQNRTEFLAEAVAMAAKGAVAILPDLRFPWTIDVTGDDQDVAHLKAQVDALDRVYASLLTQPGVDSRRTAVVGHDYGAMFGSLLVSRHPGVRAEVFMAGDATWANWFTTYFVTVDDPVAYAQSFHGLDPVDNVSHRGSRLYVQWAGQDQFVSEQVRAEFSAADPTAAVSLYPNAGHFLDQRAKDDRIAWVATELGLH
jgi:dienelactone hydrolase